MVTIAATSSWHAVVRSEDVVASELIPVHLLGRELALWRTSDGHVKAWDDRCPHRGTRLTLGTNDGGDIVCRYHGWRFSGESAQCTFVPAHPAQTPPRAAVVRTYPCVERYGLVWVSTDGEIGLPQLPIDPMQTSFTMRSVTVHAALTNVERALADGDHAGLTIVYVLHDHGNDRTTIHGVIAGDIDDADRVRVLRAQNERMRSVQRRLETGALAAAGA